MPYHNYHTTELLYKMRQAEMNKAIRSGLYVKHDDKMQESRRESFLLRLLHLMRPQRWNKKDIRK